MCLDVAGADPAHGGLGTSGFADSFGQGVREGNGEALSIFGHQNELIVFCSNDAEGFHRATFSFPALVACHALGLLLAIFRVWRPAKSVLGVTV